MEYIMIRSIVLLQAREKSVLTAKMDKASMLKVCQKKKKKKKKH